MLGVRTYDPAYVDACRRHIETAAVAVASLMEAARGDTDGAEATLLNNLVIVLDAQFVHRLRAVEGKDGNPLNEVRLLAASLLTNNGRMLADKQIKLDPASSLLGHAVGDEIRLTQPDFARLAQAYFAEIDKRFT
jgi:hypothetical protein